MLLMSSSIFFRREDHDATSIAKWHHLSTGLTLETIHHLPPVAMRTRGPKEVGPNSLQTKAIPTAPFC